jgi:hypothetical protein
MSKTTILPDPDAEITVPVPRVPSRAIVTPADMLARAIEQGASIEVLEKLMAMHERMEAGQARKKFDAAIAKAKASIPPIVRNREATIVSDNGGRRQQRYADLAGIARVVDPILADYGLSYRFRTRQDNGTIQVTCVVSHNEGHSEENTLSGPADTSGKKNPIQSIGSTLTYLQRYSLMQALGLSATDDDDGQASGGAVSGTITDEQRDNLCAMVTETGTSIERFCKYFGIASVGELPAHRYQEASRMLGQKARQR